MYSVCTVCCVCLCVSVYCVHVCVPMVCVCVCVVYVLCVLLNVCVCVSLLAPPFIFLATPWLLEKNVDDILTVFFIFSFCSQ